MKKILFLLLALIPLISSAQVGFRLFHFRPTGELGFAMERRVSGELLYMQDFEDTWRIRAGISYTSLTPRLDTFPSTAYYYSGSTGSLILPGYQVFHKYALGIISFGADYALIDKEPFFIYPGFDILVGGANISYDRYTETLSDKSTDGGGALGGIRLRLGMEYYIIENMGLFIEANTNGYFIDDYGKVFHNEYGLGLRYSFQ